MSVSTLVLVGLAVVWAVVLLPEVWKRWNQSRGDSIRSFSTQLASLERRDDRATVGRSNVIDLRRPAGSAPAPRTSAVPPAVRKRRQEVLTCLGAAAVLTLLATVAFGGTFFLLLHLVADLLLVGYVYLLVQTAKASVARSTALTPSNGIRAVPMRPLGDEVSMGRITPAPRRIAN
jgi:hypothetical protein